MSRTTHYVCGKSWGGLKAEHCPVCCETFASTDAGDSHRVGPFDGRRCLSPEEMRTAGLRESERGIWLPKLSPAEARRLSENRVPGTGNRGAA